ncbi:MBL fold metallo-hydrolase [Deinococcus maricopensis]|uniref:Beta-lactamase domain protein n=1 Tax=Deinococcus maricopensis (strain DSM 21211 / LMG 22137 / NRRL B-23946 / LB-34) TaxID=709986 RepID=E8U8K7_DEIML|nr:MBL fold metallo-hydrolase [Deinococcus maricopensis]ADV67396.1 beta-lactamase domain protein [Deinococcus maricopensis DSM 21211]
MTLTLTFLGTSDSQGVPRWSCTCAVCADARAGGANRRTRSSALLRGAGESVLLDCGPDLHAQLTREGVTHLDHAVISHAHNDHLMGLGDLLDVRAAPRPVIHAPADVIPEVAARFAYAFRNASPVRALPEVGLQAAGLTLRAFRVPHGDNGDSHAFRLDGPSVRAAYVTDALRIPDALAAQWLKNLDLLILGTSFRAESLDATRTHRSVYDVHEARALSWAVRTPRVLLTHLSHDHDVRAPDLPHGWAYAHDGLTITLA